ncbi:DNA primase [Thiohalocapsa marina]|uniref:DNA primase n=1 Tax=Thiohalocapsa marina TaxID=424902 RepID=A0A5M8FM85_9GAMM|nr:CHC2 zinc finger domain-containing protein [Thiohalocapsa marina]KAA6184241.1 DNA primase [Thiohalocapsa marina]
MLAEPFLARLQTVVRTGEQRWSACCPAHADRSPSLSIRLDGEKLLFHCHAGCAPEAVLAAMGLGWRDLYADPWVAARAAAVAHASWRGASRDLHQGIDLAVERLILRIAAADLRRGRTLSIEDRGRVEVARLRLRASKRDRPT